MHTNGSGAHEGKKIIKIDISLPDNLICFRQEKTCEESTSFDLTPYDIASAINAVDRLLVEQAKEASHGQTVTEDFNAESLSSGKKP